MVKGHVRFGHKVGPGSTDQSECAWDVSCLEVFSNAGANTRAVLNTISLQAPNIQPAAPFLEGSRAEDVLDPYINSSFHFLFHYPNTTPI